MGTSRTGRATALDAASAGEHTTTSTARSRRVASSATRRACSAGVRGASSQSSVMSYRAGQPVALRVAAPAGSLTHKTGSVNPTSCAAATTARANRASTLASTLRGNHFVGWKSQSLPSSMPERSGPGRSPAPRRGATRASSAAYNGSAAGSTKSTRKVGSVLNNPATRCWLRRHTWSHASRESTTRSVTSGPPGRGDRPHRSVQPVAPG